MVSALVPLRVASSLLPGRTTDTLITGGRGIGRLGARRKEQSADSPGEGRTTSTFALGGREHPHRRSNNSWAVVLALSFHVSVLTEPASLATSPRLARSTHAGNAETRVPRGIGTSQSSLAFKQ